MRDIHVIEENRRNDLEVVLDALPESIAIVDHNLRVFSLNKAGLAMIGISHLENLPIDVPLRLISEQYRPAFRKELEDMLGGKTQETDKPIKIELNSLDGFVHLLECTMASLLDENGITEAVIITFRNASKSQKILDTSEQNDAILKSILATVPDAMVVIDERGNISSFSVTAEALFGYAESEVVGENVSMLMPAPHREAHDGYLERYLSTKEKHIIGIGRQVEGLRKDGTIFPMQLEVGEAQIGDHCLFTGFIVDLTDKTKAADEIQTLQAELLHASRLSAVGTLASALAHEINQPLTAIANYLSAARDLIDGGLDNNEELFREALQESVSESLRAGKIVRRLREFVAKGEINRQIISIAQLIEDATTLGLIGANEKGVSWSIDIAPDSNHVFVDRVQIQQVMVNLMRNAIEAMEDSPVKQLSISVKSHSDERVEIAVSDTGSGIDPEIGDTIFDPFSSTKGSGLGLGLSICRTIIEAHEGKLSVEPNSGGGTIFHITLVKALGEQLDGE